MASESLKLGRAWDDTFYEWTSSLQLGKKKKKMAAAKGGASGWTGSATKAKSLGDYSGKGSKADVRGRLQGIARRSKQVMVKITAGKNRTMKSIRAHMAYLSRDGEETLRDQDGREVSGTEALKEAAWGWQYAGPTMEENSQYKQAFNIVFSMPEGTDERALYQAVKATAEVEFAGHQWVIVQHFDEPQVHCHICVKAESMEGDRLNPRKADLQRWRENFAYELRQRGVEAEATRRATRIQKEKINKPWAVTRMDERGQPTNPLPSSDTTPKAEKWKATESRVSNTFEKIITSLGQSDEAIDRVLAQDLRQTLEQTKENARSNGRTTPHERERA